jgi:hypothetical protein
VFHFLIAILTVIMLGVIMLNVIVMNVVAPFFTDEAATLTGFQPTTSIFSILRFSALPV